MADNITNITTTVNYQSASDEGLLDLVNSISRKLNGIDAQESGINPTKTDIIDELNDIQRVIVGNKNWRFLRDVGTVTGYSADSETTEYTDTSLTASADSNLSSGLVSSVTDYFADAYTPSSTIKPSTLVFKIGSIAAGAGVVSGTITGIICPDNGGSPDTDNPITTSDSHTFSASDYPPVESLSDYTLTFSNVAADEVLIEGTKYWLVLKMEYASDNGDTMSVGTTNETGETMYNKSEAGWTAYTSKKLYWELNGYECTFLSELTLSTSVQKVYRLYYGNVNAPTVNLLEWQDDKFTRRPTDIPTDSFTQRPYADSGAINLYINSSYTKVPVWNVEYKKKVTALVNDNDIPLIPSGYRTLLKYKALINFIDRGLGTQDSGNLENLRGDIEILYKAMRAEYLPKPARSFRVNKGGYTAFEDSDDIPNRSYVDLGNYPENITNREIL